MSDLSPRSKSLAVIGYGELARQVLFHADVEPKAVFDDHFNDDSLEVFNFNNYQESLKDYTFLIGLGYHHLSLKNKILSTILDHGGQLFGWVSNSCFISKTAKIEKGVIVYPMSNIDKDVVIGNGTLINNSVIVSHNSTIGNCCYLSPGVILSGNVQVGENVFIGSGSIVSNNVSIGDNVRIGIGSVVTKDVPANSSVLGCHSRLVSRKINLS